MIEEVDAKKREKDPTNPARSILFRRTALQQLKQTIADVIVLKLHALQAVLIEQEYQSRFILLMDEDEGLEIIIGASMSDGISIVQN